MPISSGARGHVGYGVDTSIRWFPEGGRKLYMPLSSKVNSYLQRYLYCHPEAKNRCFDKHSEGFPNIGRKPQPAWNTSHSSKETFKADKKLMQKNQQQSTAPPNGSDSTAPATNSTSPTSIKTANKNHGCKADASRSSLCILL